jgi:L-ribulokinase
VKANYTIGIDFGTDSVRAILVETTKGEVVSEGVSNYSRWSEGKYCDLKTNQFRQHPLDHLESLKIVLQLILKKVSQDIINKIRAISIASTGSTPIAVNKKGVPLSLTEGFEENPNAMFILWKDHTALKEAKEINDLAHSGKYIDYTEYVGGEYSSEWFWAKILHIIRKDEKVRNAAYSWVEHCDWIPAMLTGTSITSEFKRSRCAAGHKAMWHQKWKGLPPDDFLINLDPLLSGIRERLYTETYTADKNAGTISNEWAEIFGLPVDVIIGVGTLDAHMGAIGGEIKSNYLVKVIGTSTCDMLVISKDEIKDKVVSGICGQVDGSILPGMIGLEAGQSAFGDIYAWFNKLLIWPLEMILMKSKTLDNETKDIIIKELKDQILSELSKEAISLPIDESGLVALDWLNGRRTPNSNQALKGGLIGLTLSTDAPKIFRALVEATCFGSKKIMDRFLEEGVSIKGVIAVGGVAQKSEFVMQTLTDILNFPIKVIKSKETCALGAAISAAVVAGIHNNFQEAQNAMGSGFEKEYFPIAKNVEKYNRLYQRYSELADFVELETNGKL